MASAYSTPKQFDNYVQPVNIELVNFVLGSKEQKFNYNIAKVEQTLADFGNLGLVRDQDKEYLADRINSMVTSMGDLENADWSDSNVERQITSGIRGAIDDKVMKDVQMSRSYTAYMEQVKAIKDKDPDKYSDVNFAMGLKMAGADKWMKGEADEFGSLQYMPYVDVKGEQNKAIQEYIKTHGDERIEEYDDEIAGVKVQRKIKGLSRAQVESIWEANMTPQQRQQLQMEGMFYAEQLPEAQRGEVIERYKDNISKEVKVYKNLVDDLKSQISKTSGAKQEELKAQLLQAEGNVAKMEETINKPVDYQSAYMDSYYQMNKGAVVSANAFERVTDIDRDMTLLNALKVNAQIAKLGREEAADAATAAGNNLTIAPSGGIDGEATQMEVYTTQVMQELDSSINGLVGSVAQAAKDPSVNFKQTYGIDAHEFNKKSAADKQAFVTSIFKNIEDGQDLKAEGGYTPEVINAYYNYKSSSTAFEAVNSGIKSASDGIARKTFEGMVAGFKGGDLKIDNFQNPVIRNIIKKAGNKGIDFDGLSSDERKAFRVAMLDESIRGNHVNQDELLPYIYQNREELINSIEDPNLKKDFLSNEEMAKGGLERLTEGVGAFLQSTANIVGETIAAPVSWITGKEVYSESRAATEKMNNIKAEIRRRNGVPFDFLISDKNIDDLNTRWTGERDMGDVMDKDASAYIQTEYRAAVESARMAAGDAAKRMPSTYVISLSPKVKVEGELARKGQQRIAIDQGFGTDDLANNAVQVHYNKSDNTVRFSTVMKSSSQKFFGREGDRIMSNPVPIDQLTDMPEIMNKIQRDETPWALDTRNPHAAPVKFTTTGFDDATEQSKAIQKLAPYMSTAQFMRLKAAPHSIGYTKPKLHTMFSEAKRQTPDGEQRTFAQEFPNAFRALVGGAGKFEINYESAHNQGYYATVNYVVGDKQIPIQPPTLVGETIDYRTEYLNSFQRQKQVMDMIAKGYAYGDEGVMDKLKEIEALYGQ